MLQSDTTTTSNNNNNKDTSHSAFTISQLQSFFFVFLFTMFVSIMCFLLETAYYLVTLRDRRQMSHLPQAPSVEVK